MKIKFLKAAIVGLVFSISSFAHAGLITTNGGSAVGGFSSSEVYGQSFLVGIDNVLDSVQLTGRSTNGVNQGVIYELFKWDDALNRVVNGSLFTTSGSLIASNSLLDINIMTGGWELITGQKYIFSMRHDDANGSGNWGFGASGTNDYIDGGFNYSQITSNRYLNNSWTANHGGVSRDLHIQMNFSASSIPEPSTLAIFALGMIGLASRQFKKQS